jgi:hypothetical protein
MHVILAALVCASSGAILFRIRGGLLGDYGIRGVGTTASRLIYAIVLAGALAILGGNYWLGLLAPAFFIGCALPWWQSIDMGRDKGNRAKDFILQSARGAIFTIPAGAVLWGLDLPWWPGLAGLSAGVLYEIGWRIPSKVRGLERGSPIGEALLGAVIGLAFGIVACA